MALGQLPPVAIGDLLLATSAQGVRSLRRARAGELAFALASANRALRCARRNALRAAPCLVVV